MENVTRSLFVPLTADEVAMCSNELARITTELSEIEDEKKSVMSSFKDRIDRHTLESRSLSRKVMERREMRQVECSWTINGATKRAVLVRDDTGEIVEERKATPEELQGKLDL